MLTEHIWEFCQVLPGPLPCSACGPGYEATFQTTHMGTTSLEPRRGGGEKSAWYPLFAHALNYNIKPRGFMQMTSQNFPSVNNDVYTTQRIHEDLIALTLGTWSVINAMRDETTMTTL